MPPQPPGFPPPPVLTYVDRPDLLETYADLLGRLLCDGATVRMEFVINRLDDARPNTPPTGKTLPAARVVIPVHALPETIRRLQALMAQLQAGGVLRPIHQPEGAQKPN